MDHRARRKSLHAGAVTALFLTDAAAGRDLEAELASLRAGEG